MGFTSRDVLSMFVVENPDERGVAAVRVSQSFLVSSPGRIPTSRIESGPTFYLTLAGVEAIKANVVDCDFARWRLSGEPLAVEMFSDAPEAV